MRSRAHAANVTAGHDGGTRSAPSWLDWKDAGVRRVLYPAYEARVAAPAAPDAAARSTSGVMLDGNRRWAKAVGADTAHGHRAGAPTSSRCSAGARRSASRWSRCGCSPPTTSTAPPERARRRCSAIIERRRRVARRAAALAAAPGRGARPAADRRPPSGSRRPPRPPATSTGCWSTSPSGYGGRREIADAVRSLLARARRARAPRWRSWPRSSTSSTSPSTSTPRASPTPTW